MDVNKREEKGESPDDHRLEGLRAAIRGKTGETGFRLGGHGFAMALNRGTSGHLVGHGGDCWLRLSSASHGFGSSGLLPSMVCHIDGGSPGRWFR